MKKNIVVFVTVIMLVLSMLAGCNAPVPPVGVGGENSAPIADAPNESVEGSNDTSGITDGVETSGIPEDEENGDSSRDEVSFEVSGDYNPDTDVSSEESAPYDPDAEASTEPEPEPEPEPDDDIVISAPVVKRPVLNIPQITGDAWDGTVAKGFESGTGTENDPFIIKTAEQLAFFANSVNSGNSYEGQFIALGASIKLNEGTPSPEADASYNKWTSIATGKNYFDGTFDGKGYVVAGVYEGSLFGYVRGNIKNLGVVYSYVRNGGIVNTTVRKDSPEMPTISNCYFAEGTVVGGGGIAAAIGGSIIDGCANWGTIICEADWCGGIVGFAQFSYVKNCYNGGTVKGESTLAGIVGNFLTGEVSRCFNEGEVTGGMFVGGIIGNSMEGMYYRLVNAGKLTGQTCAGIVIDMMEANPLDDCYYLEGTAEQGSACISPKDDFPQFAVAVSEGQLADLVE